ncbi:Kae1-associated serine/threonine protein kinase [Candidatus Pacearchaeota archaeon]|nr:Kae1-associated serine/threonine protein kinase [Candidatus Pacearchaeota archaeon]
MKKLIAQGAEAKIFLNKERISKERISKGYRHPELDNQIRKSRTKHEGKILLKAKQLKINVPEIFNINKKGEPLSKFNLEIEYIPGDRLSENLNKYPKTKQKMAMEKLGEQVAKLHENDIIHGDLTTSNTILFEEKVFIIDFGLGCISTKIENKAVDLHLIKQALEAKHFQNHEDLFKQFCNGYKFEESDKILERLEVVEKRGRYKH